MQEMPLRILVTSQLDTLPEISEFVDARTQQLEADDELIDYGDLVSDRESGSSDGIGSRTLRSMSSVPE
jgi:hypothetical protein